MRRLFYLSLLFLMAANAFGLGLVTSFYTRGQFLSAPPAVFDDGLIGSLNPAVNAYQKMFDIRFHWATEGDDAGSFQDWALYAGHKFGFGVLHQEFGDQSVTDYQLSLGLGGKGSAFGLGYSWSTGDDESLGREKLLSVGQIIRPCKHASLGVTGVFSMDSKWNQVVGELGIRPLGTPFLTIFGDGAWSYGEKFKDAPWSAGAAVEVVPGISFVGRYFEDESFTLGLTLELGHSGVSSQAHFDTDQDLSRYSYGTRVGSLRPSIIPEFTERDKYYTAFNLTGKVVYNKYAFFDGGKTRLYDLLHDIRVAVADIRVAALVINLSGITVAHEHAWEIREELRLAREAGKKVFVFIDYANMTEYHLASVADAIIMDPVGLIMLQGYAMGRTYFKGTLEKLGLGFDEWRFFKYKSAVESMSRDSFSEADREQRQDYIDDRYESVRDDICAGRNLTIEQFDGIVDDTALFLASTAQAMGLVDTLARWSDAAAITRQLLHRRLRPIPTAMLWDKAVTSADWGPKPQVALVYALGECALDNGINARQLEKTLLSLAKKKSVKAVVLRVDSPGGDGLASDMVADALRKCAERKPVIVSQGQVAASGGYWISMYADTILAGPQTITGSIGVIGGWIYDQGLSEKLGMTSDYVKRGEHAEAGFGVTLPFLGLTVPARNLTDEERGLVEARIREMYDGFVKKVAVGRKMSEDSIRVIGEGHFYSGIEGRKIGLVDEIGGMMSSITLAAAKAGIDPEEDFEVLEIPRWAGLFHIGNPLSPFKAEIENSDIYQYLEMYARNPWRPLWMLLPGTYPTVPE